MAFAGDSIFWVEVEKIVPNPFQPRREFDESKLKELSESIRMYGILQPLTVTRKEIHTDDGAFRSEYELIAGERRLRASKLAGLSQVPVIIREGEDSEQEKLELAIIENLQREDLNGVDRALAFRQLSEVFGLSHSQVAAKVGRSREYVSNTIRLLMLPDYMLEALRRADISEGHARTLLMLNDRPEEQDTVYREILLKKLSVREVERITRKIAQDKVRSKKWKDTDPELIEMEKKFTESLGTRVQIAKTDYGGKITIDYFSEEDLVDLMDRLKQDRREAAAKSAAAVAAVTEEITKEAEANETASTLAELGSATPLDVVAEPEDSPASTAEIDMNSPRDQENVVTESAGEPKISEPDITLSSPAEPAQTASPAGETPAESLAEGGLSEETPQSAPETSETTEVAKEEDVPRLIPPESVATAESGDDESGLYAIRNFGV